LDVLSFFVESYPGACSTSDANGKLPIHYACELKGVTDAYFGVILSLNPEGAYVIDSFGNSPIHYVRSNPNKVTKEAVLIALNESKVCTQMHASATPNELSTVVRNVELWSAVEGLKSQLMNSTQLIQSLMEELKLQKASKVSSAIKQYKAQIIKICRLLLALG
jgi:hypothetical protein